MIDAVDRQRALQGYAVELSTDEVLHVWPLSETESLTVIERRGEAHSAAVSIAGCLPLTEKNAAFLGEVWAALLTKWRRRVR